MINYIAIEGCIGVGKTTLSEKLAELLHGTPFREMFEENPFLSDFYKNPEAYAFQTQISFLLSRFKQQQALQQQDLFQRPLVSDYLMAKDRIFAELTLKGSEFALYDQLYQTLGRQVQVPDLLIFLRAPLDVIVNRIERRGRPFEKNISKSYLQDLMSAYDRFIAGFHACPVLTVETEELNFPGSLDDVNFVFQAATQMIEKELLSHCVTAGDKKQFTLFAS